MGFEINNFTIEAEKKSEAQKFWRCYMQTDECVRTKNNGQAFKRFGNIYVSYDDWQTWENIIYLSPKTQEEIKNK